MLFTINRIFVAVLLVLVLIGIAISLFTMVMDFTGQKNADEKFSAMKTNAALYLESMPSRIRSNDSPEILILTVKTPALSKSDLVYLEAYAGGKLVAETDCLEELDYESSEYVGNTSVQCELYLPYDYEPAQDYDVYAILHSGNDDYFSGPGIIAIDWTDYERSFWNAFTILVLILGVFYLLIIVPLAIISLYKGMDIKHDVETAGEYTLDSLLHPLRIGKTLLGKFNSFIISPYFWGMEILGILVILTYMSISAEAWRNDAALGSYFLSGIAAFAIPFLWCVAFWYADFREREPMRVLVTFFLWGCLAALMAIGINNVSDVFLEMFGLGILGAILIAPPMEELYKGAGLTLLSEHHEYDSVEDGLAYGFVIGMGFSFIENWLYLLGNPFSASILGWLLLFVLRSLFFSANHGIFTAITGGVIGWFREKKFSAPALGLIPGVAIAAVFHAIHNSGGLLIALLGFGGVLTYCCLLIPLFDYGGLVLLIMVFIWAVFRKRRQ